MNIFIRLDGEMFIAFCDLFVAMVAEMFIIINYN